MKLPELISDKEVLVICLPRSLTVSRCTRSLLASRGGATSVAGLTHWCGCTGPVAYGRSPSLQVVRHGLCTGRWGLSTPGWGSGSGCTPHKHAGGCHSFCRRTAAQSSHLEPTKQKRRAGYRYFQAGSCCLQQPLFPLSPYHDHTWSLLSQAWGDPSQGAGSDSPVTTPT